ncbi:hypothetical protein [Paenibacillus sp. MSJ-34]|uniref:hypothetical protein n=1 Tax=Paenibacillus sp. MSJ-34 TaxID=2841529 RepID=UPI001C1249C9|nr:hypothetical protein [Paenibacillus sp. MSJ-34]MBU5442272.1 hypothetical protein [Paenibacillus sp. MSJ-34]
MNQPHTIRIPTIGFDPDMMRETPNAPEQYVPVMLMTIGKADVSSERPRGYRKPTGEFATYNSFA